MRKFIELQLKETFKDQASFTKQELESFFRLYEPDLNDHTFYSRMRALKNRRVIMQLNRDIYTLSTKKQFIPENDKELGELGLLVMDFMQTEPYCIWDSSWINQFSRHQTMKNFHIVEVDKAELLSLFHFLKDKGRESVFLDPDQDILYLYAREKEVPIVLKTLISRSPLIETANDSTKLIVPSLEKILVDVYTDVVIFNYIQGAELATIFESAITKYAINFTKLFAYARRRNKADQLRAYLRDHFSHLLKSIAL